MDYDISYAYSGETDEWEVKLSGEFDIFNSDNLKAELNGLIGQKNISMVIDCFELSFMDSTAIGSLVAVFKNMNTYGGKIALKNLKPNLMKLFRITSLDSVFEIEGESDE